MNLNCCVIRIMWLCVQPTLFENIVHEMVHALQEVVTARQGERLVNYIVMMYKYHERFEQCLSL